MALQRKPKQHKTPAAESAMKEVLKTKPHRLNVEIDRALFIRVRQRAMEKDTTVSAVIRRLLDEYAE